MGTISDSQKKARDKWDAENMATIGCKLKKEQAEKFKALAKSQGTTANALLKSFILDAISEEETNYEAKTKLSEG